MKIARQITVFDAADIAAESAFWAGLLGGTVYEDDDFHSVIVDGKWRFGVQLAPNHVPPEWPDGPQQQQIHLDLHVEDIRAAHEHAISLGARLLKAADETVTAAAERLEQLRLAVAEDRFTGTTPPQHRFVRPRGSTVANHAAGSAPGGTPREPAGAGG